MLRRWFVPAVTLCLAGVAVRPDLNVVGGYDCSGAGTTQDSDGHGTHVAGDPHHLLNGKYYGDLAWTGGY